MRALGATSSAIPTQPESAPTEGDKPQVPRALGWADIALLGYAIFVHLVTLALAGFTSGLGAAAMTAFTPPLAQLYWLYAVWQKAQTFLTPFHLLTLAGLVGWAVLKGIERLSARQPKLANALSLGLMAGLLAPFTFGLANIFTSDGLVQGLTRDLRLSQWVSYQNDKLGFECLVPRGWEVNDCGLESSQSIEYLCLRPVGDASPRPAVILFCIMRHDYMPEVGTAANLARIAEDLMAAGGVTPRGTPQEIVIDGITAVSYVYTETPVLGNRAYDTTGFGAVMDSGTTHYSFRVFGAAREATLRRVYNKLCSSLHAFAPSAPLPPRTRTHTPTAVPPPPVPSRTPTPPNPARCAQATVNCNLRDCALDTCAVIRVIAEGEVVRYLTSTQDGQRHQVQDSEGRVGWVWADYLRPVSCDSTSTTQSVPAGTAGCPLAGSLTAAQAGSHVGEWATVCFHVVKANDAGTAFLVDSGTTRGAFYAVIFPDDWAKFPQSLQSYFYGRCVCVSGRIQLYEGSPEIILEDPSGVLAISYRWIRTHGHRAVT